MTTITKFTKDQLTERARRKVKELEFAITQSAFTSIRDGLKEELELARIALASLTAEPVAWKYRLVDIDSGAEDHWKYSTQCITPASGKTYRIESIPLYTVSQPVPVPVPVPERERIRREHAEWSDATFGDVGPIGPLKHLSKEALEAAAEPSDLSEWADMQFLLWDAQRRMGLSDEFITRAMIEKLEINKSRQWPEPKDGEPRLHIKEQPAPVVPEEITADGIIGMHECGFVEGWNACRAAMLQGSQPVSNCDELSSPVIPDGYALVPIVPTEDMVINGFESEPDPHFSDEKVWAEYEALSGCRRAARRAELCWAAMIKAAPKQEGNNR